MQPPPRLDKDKRASLLEGGGARSEDWKREQRLKEIERQNDEIIDDHTGQALLQEQEQDESLDVLHQSVLRIGEMGLGIRDELHTQSRLIDELDEGVDTTAARIQHMRKEVDKILKSGTRSQLCLLAGLIVALLVLTMLVFLLD